MENRKDSNPPSSGGGKYHPIDGCNQGDSPVRWIYDTGIFGRCSSASTRGTAAVTAEPEERTFRHREERAGKSEPLLLSLFMGISDIWWPNKHAEHDLYSSYHTLIIALFPSVLLIRNLMVELPRL